jgi:hypothetical protein
MIILKQIYLRIMKILAQCNIYSKIRNSQIYKYLNKNIQINNSKNIMVNARIFKIWLISSKYFNNKTKRIKVIKRLNLKCKMNIMTYKLNRLVYNLIYLL